MSNNKQNENNNAKHQFSNTEPLTHAQKVAVANKMSNNKQGSVEWFIDQLEEKGDAWENASIRRVNISIDVSEYMELKTKAKAMHKEEMVEFSQEVFRNRYNQVYQSLGNIADDIYNETFENNNEQK